MIYMMLYIIPRMNVLLFFPYGHGNPRIHFYPLRFGAVPGPLGLLVLQPIDHPAGTVPGNVTISSREFLRPVAGCKKREICGRSACSAWPLLCCHPDKNGRFVPGASMWPPPRPVIDLSSATQKCSRFLLGIEDLEWI